jgi:colicin import membrane protein
VNAQVQVIEQVEPEAQPASAVVEYTETERNLADLRERFQGVVYDVTTTKGDKEARVARQQLVKLRTGLDKKRLDLNAADRARIELRNNEAQRITAEIVALEDPIDAQIKAEETRKENERQARIEAEEKRVAAIQERIDEFRGVIPAAAGCTAAEILEHIGDIERRLVDSSFDEFQQTAVDAKDAVLGRLRQMHTAAVETEAQQAKIKADLEELARLREAETLRQAAERRRIADEANAAKVAQDAENARQEALRIARQEEDDRQSAARQKVLDDQAQQLAEQRAEIERQREQLRKAREPAPVLPEIVVATTQVWDSRPAQGENALLDSTYAEQAATPQDVPHDSGIEVGSILSRRSEMKAPTVTEIVVALHKEWPAAHPTVILEWLQAIDWHMQCFVEAT